jgi:hypothetical protein
MEPFLCSEFATALSKTMNAIDSLKERIESAVQIGKKIVLLLRDRNISAQPTQESFVEQFLKLYFDKEQWALIDYKVRNANTLFRLSDADIKTKTNLTKRKRKYKEQLVNIYNKIFAEDKDPSDEESEVLDHIGDVAGSGGCDDVGSAMAASSSAYPDFYVNRTCFAHVHDWIGAGDNTCGEEHVAAIAVIDHSSLMDTQVQRQGQIQEERVAEGEHVAAVIAVIDTTKDKDISSGNAIAVAEEEHAAAAIAGMDVDDVVQVVTAADTHAQRQEQVANAVGDMDVDDDDIPVASLMEKEAQAHRQGQRLGHLAVTVGAVTVGAVVDVAGAETATCAGTDADIGAALNAFTRFNLFQPDFLISLKWMLIFLNFNDQKNAAIVNTQWYKMVAIGFGKFIIILYVYHVLMFLSAVDYSIKNVLALGFNQRSNDAVRYVTFIIKFQCVTNFVNLG